MAKRMDYLQQMSQILASGLLPPYQTSVDMRMETRTVIKDINLAGFSMKLRMEVEDCSMSCPGHLIVHMTVPDRVTGIVREIPAVAHITDIATGNLTKTLENVRKFVHDVVTHEFHEMFLYKGKRVFDPHNPVTRPANVKF